ncbi:LytTR family transcriptional regulator DNA-binding domain-containing protein [Halosquirtibacter xylanolyticus]|uniref:LytR/AlgR family response regulator transcription factor n=1 Tax=Halosquirtibacter xylanolyticus TaxID=3374599 RepID=UPI003747C7E2|nr:LytTR family transcriptional regulator DNA-binding domain-containing protein [Prolixibacteraceae bacterium]
MSIEQAIPKKSRKIVIRVKEKTHFINIEEISYLHCDCYLTTVHTCIGEKITVARLLKYFEEDLLGEGFVRVNRNILINCKKVKSFERGGNRMITMDTKERLKASRRGLVKLKLVIDNQTDYFLP